MRFRMPLDEGHHHLRRAARRGEQRQDRHAGSADRRDSRQGVCFAAGSLGGFSFGSFADAWAVDASFQATVPTAC